MKMTKREWVELIIFLALLQIPPFVAERYYGVNWLLAALITAVIVVPLAWKPLRLKKPW